MKAALVFGRGTEVYIMPKVRLAHASANASDHGRQNQQGISADVTPVGGVDQEESLAFQGGPDERGPRAWSE